MSWTLLERARVLEELDGELAAAAAGVPLTVRDLVLARAGGLPADAQEVVRLVAVVPTPAELWLLERALGPPPPTP